MKSNYIYYYLFLFFVIPYIYFCYKRVSLIILKNKGISNEAVGKVLNIKFYYIKLFFSLILSLFLNPITLLSEVHKDRIVITDYNKLLKKKKFNVFIYLQTIYLSLLFTPLTKNSYMTTVVAFLYSLSFLGFYMNFLEAILKMIYFEILSWIVFLIVYFYFFF